MNSLDIDWVFTRIPLLRGLAPGDFTLAPLPGYTNLNYRLYNREHDWVLRLPRHETNRYLDRAVEAHNQALSGELGLAVLPDWRDASGITLTPTLKHSRAIEAAELVDPEMLQLVIQSLQRLHRSGLGFRGEIDLGELLQRYFALLDGAQQESLRPRMAEAGQTLLRVKARDAAWVPSHNDLVLENLLLAPDRLWFIDWEYSAMASPCWDLATLCNAAQLSDDQGRHLLQVYADGAEAVDESLLFDYRSLLQLLNDCWMAAFVPA